MENAVKRDIAPDVLRGFALLGILIVNIPFMALNSQEGAHGRWVAGLTNASAGFIILALFAGKFYILFSFLFGYSASYIVKGEERNRGRWIRRSLVLMVIGVMHFSLLWHGDILFLYGLMGLLLIPFLFRTDKTLKRWAKSIYSVFTIILIVAVSSFLIGERLNPEDLERETEYASRLDGVMVNGSFLESIAPRIELWVIGLAGGFFLQGGFVFAAFLTGLRAGREKWLSEPFEKLNLKRMISVGLLVGLPIQLLAAAIFIRNEQLTKSSEAIYFSSIVLAFIAAPLLTMAYLSIILKALKSRGYLVTWLASAGKMSLSLYIGQSLIVSLIFGPWGLGLFQKMELWAVLLTAIFIWFALVLSSKIILKRFKQGPLESLVHSASQRKFVARKKQ